MIKLSNPLYNRRIKDVPLPVINKLSDDILFDNKKTINLYILLNHLINQGRLYKFQIINIINTFNKIIIKEKNLININNKNCIIFGNIHGKFYDLINILLNVQEYDFENNIYIFMGNYINYGNFSVEVLIYLFSWKINYPKNVYLLRGNHESNNLFEYLNFKKECLYKYDEEIYFNFCNILKNFPLACWVNSRFLIVHSGISPNLKKITDINLINRFKNKSNGILTDILFSEPIDNLLGENEIEFENNEEIGTSYKFKYFN